MDTTTAQQLLTALNRQQQLLEMILGTLERPKLGFHNDAGTVFVYCNRSRDCLWYTLDAGNPVPISHTALTGYLRQLKFEKCQRRGKEVHKLLTTIQGDRLYSLESGHDSHFSKGILSAISILTPQQLLQPITIQPVAGDDESVLFCRVWADSEQVKAPYDDSTDWRETAKRAIANCKAANEMPF
jgi:hypothetical protein